MEFFHNKNHFILIKAFIFFVYRTIILKNEVFQVHIIIILVRLEWVMSYKKNSQNKKSLVYLQYS